MVTPSFTNEETNAEKLSSLPKFMQKVVELGFELEKCGSRVPALSSEASPLPCKGSIHRHSP